MPQIENGAVVSEFPHLEKCLAIAAHRADASQDGNFTLAEVLANSGPCAAEPCCIVRANGLAPSGHP
jgi:hypothetical protein